MNEQMGTSLGNCMRRKFTGPGLRAGIAKDQLIFTIICSAAIAVAVVALVYSLTRSKVPTTPWQCLDCNYELSMATTEMPPIKCRKCGGQAVRLNYRICPECGKQNLINRVRLTEQSQAKREEIEAAGGRQEQDRRPSMIGPVATIMMLPKECQYWTKQTDGSYGWTPWISAGSPAAIQCERKPPCSECGAGLTFGSGTSRSKR